MKRNRLLRRQLANVTSWDQRLTNYKEEPVMEMTVSKLNKLEPETYIL